ncbi:chitinase [Vibrio astriarenae]|nr:chitinase [Vibrio sp. C7]
METTSGYLDMVKYHEQAEITLKFNQWSGERGETYNIYFDGKQVATGPITSSQTTASFQYGQGGRYQLEIEACDATGCSRSRPAEIVVADTDGAHLAPLTMNIDPNNGSFNTDPSTVVVHTLSSGGSTAETIRLIIYPLITSLTFSMVSFPFVGRTSR